MYIIISAICLSDKRGRLFYFLEDPTNAEYTFETAKEIFIKHPSWTIKTDDWGHFRRATNSSDEFWNDYDVFATVITLTVLIGFFWITSCVIDITKLLRNHWDFAYHVLYLI